MEQRMYTERNSDKITDGVNSLYVLERSFIAFAVGDKAMVVAKQDRAAYAAIVVRSPLAPRQPAPSNTP